ncbi:MAG: hypothetical protein LBI94_04885, partial [Treponema sp.]|nr:hypothetical protein [Treponema sp.]
MFARLSAAAVLAAFLSAGLTACLNPVTAAIPENTSSGNVTPLSPKTPGKTPGIPGGEPFTMSVQIDDAARAIA